LGFDVLPADNVVYAQVAGPYGQASAAYPGIFRFMGERGWAMQGPIRETFLVDPSSVRSPEELVTEVQIAWRAIF
jgi:effector-binding domain-containing protein